MSDVTDGLVLLRLETLRATVRAELQEATTWRVEALPSPGMLVTAGPHRVSIMAAHPVRGRIDLVAVMVTDGVLRLYSLPGTTSSSPAPPALPGVGDWGRCCPLALVHVHAATSAIYAHNIAPIDTPKWRPPTGPTIDRLQFRSDA